jgi:hypothetical protein
VLWNGSDFMATVVRPPRIGFGKTRMTNDPCLWEKLPYQVVKLGIGTDAITVVRFTEIKCLKFMR